MGKANANEGFVKVIFTLEANAWHGYATESLWAEPLGRDRYRLKNSPFYMRDISYDDEIAAKIDKDNRLIFQGVLKRGGHSTYRLILKTSAEGNEFRDHWEPIENLGCSFEGIKGKLLSIDVPPQVDVHKLYALLQVGENDEVWDFEEGHYNNLKQ